MSALNPMLFPSCSIVMFGHLMIEHDGNNIKSNVVPVMFDHQVTVYAIDMQAASVVGPEWRGHFVQGGGHQEPAAKESFLPSEQVFSRGIYCTCRKSNPGIPTLCIFHPVTAGPIAVRASRNDRYKRHES